MCCSIERGATVGAESGEGRGRMTVEGDPVSIALAGCRLAPPAHAVARRSHIRSRAACTAPELPQRRPHRAALLSPLAVHRMPSVRPGWSAPASRPCHLAWTPGRPLAGLALGQAVLRGARSWDAAQAAIHGPSLPLRPPGSLGGRRRQRWAEMGREWVRRRGGDQADARPRAVPARQESRSTTINTSPKSVFRAPASSTAPSCPQTMTEYHGGLTNKKKAECVPCRAIAQTAGQHRRRPHRPPPPQSGFSSVGFIPADIRPCLRGLP